MPSARASPSSPASAPISSPDERGERTAPCEGARAAGSRRRSRRGRRRPDRSGSRGRSAEPARDRCRRATAVRASEAPCRPPRSAPGPRAGCREARRRPGRGAGRRPLRSSDERSLAIVCSSGTKPWLAASASAAASSGEPAKSSSAIGWSCRFPPTPGRSWTTSIPSRSRSAAGPMPERSRIAGVPYVPAESTTRSASITIGRPAWIAWIRAGRLSATSTRSTIASPRTARFGRSRTGSRYRERGVHAHAVADVGGERARADVLVEVVQVAHARDSELLGRVEHGAVEGPELRILGLVHRQPSSRPRGTAAAARPSSSPCSRSPPSRRSRPGCPTAPRSRCAPSSRRSRAPARRRSRGPGTGLPSRSPSRA